MRRTFLSFTIAAVMAAVLIGCGGGYSSPSAPSSSAGAPADNAITIAIRGQNGALSFSPNPATAGGQLIVFKNNDNIVHRVILNDGTLDTGDIGPGGTSRAILMPASGTNYHCSIHPSMVGSVSPASGGAPPPCEGAYC